MHNPYLFSSCSRKINIERDSPAGIGFGLVFYDKQRLRRGMQLLVCLYKKGSNFYRNHDSHGLCKLIIYLTLYNVYSSQAFVTISLDTEILV